MRIESEALTFDDVLLIPSYSTVLPKDVDLSTYLTPSIKLGIPLLSAAMDTVTESPLAIALALEGGLGVIHKNLSIESQTNEVLKVKRYESHIIGSPITLSPIDKVSYALSLMSLHNISGLPVVDNNSLVGIVTSRDLRFAGNPYLPVSTFMTPKDRLVTVKEGVGRDEISDLLHSHRIEKLLVVSDNFELRGLVTVKDIQKAKDFPHACRDSSQRLRCGAAIGVGPTSYDRVHSLASAGVDVLFIDTAHAHSKGVLDMTYWVKSTYPSIPLVVGNIVTPEAALLLSNAGADAVKVGIGPGSICTTRIVAGVGVPQLSAIDSVSSALSTSTTNVVADGGIRYSGDIAKAIAVGAHTVMLGSLFAGTSEAPGDIELFQGRSYKSYRGMGSIGAMSSTHSSKDRYSQSDTPSDKLVPEGVEGRIPYRGPLSGVVHQLLGGLRSSMGYTGCSSIDDLRTLPSFVKITPSGVVESHVHDVFITKESSNYQSRLS